MRVVIAGGHGTIALLLTTQLRAAGHEPVGLVRNPDHVADVEAAGGRARVVDLEDSSAEAVGELLTDAGAVVFAAGAGPNSGAARKLTVDRDGAVLLADAARLAGVQRYLMVSAMGADDYDPDSDEVFQVYLRAKADADTALRDSGLAWTIVRPGHLTDEAGNGRVHIAAHTGAGSVPRADVAAVLVACLARPDTAATQFELIGGDDTIAVALEQFLD